MRRNLGLVVALAAIVGLAGHAHAAMTVLGQYGAGVKGYAGGQLDTPHGAAVGLDGSVFVADTLNDRMSAFAPDGTFRYAWGQDVIQGGITDEFEICMPTDDCGPGFYSSYEGAVLYPGAVAIDPATGNVIVADEDNNRIHVFAPTGHFVRTFGFDVAYDGEGNVGPEVCTHNCLAGDETEAAGGFQEPEGVAVAPNGDILVADHYNNRIDVYASEGTFKYAFGRDVVPGGPSAPEVCTTDCKAGTVSTEPGAIPYPTAVAVDANGNVAVAELSNLRVSIFGIDGTFKRIIQLAGPAFPSGVAFAADGTLWVAVKEENRLLRFDLNGTPLGSFGGPGILGEVNEVTADCNGGLIVADSSNNRIVRIGEEGTPAPPQCSGPPSADPAPTFTLGKFKRNKKNGTGRLTVTVSAPGSLALSGKKVKPASAAAATAGDVKLKVKAAGKSKRKLKRKGKLNVKLAVTYSPTTGAANPSTKSTKVKLKRKRKRH